MTAAESAEALLAESCVCTEGDPCDYHAATCTTCTPRCTGHPAEPVASATEPAVVAGPCDDCKADRDRLRAERDAALARADRLAAELATARRLLDRARTALRFHRVLDHKDTMQLVADIDVEYRERGPAKEG